MTLARFLNPGLIGIAALVGFSSAPLLAQQEVAAPPGSDAESKIAFKGSDTGTQGVAIELGLAISTTHTCTALGPNGELALAELQTIATSVVFELSAAPTLPPGPNLEAYENNCGLSNLSVWFRDMELYTKLVLGCIDPNEYLEEVSSPLAAIEDQEAFVSVVTDAVADALPQGIHYKLAPVSENVSGSLMFVPLLVPMPDASLGGSIDGLAAFPWECTPNAIPEVDDAWQLVYVPDGVPCGDCQQSGTDTPSWKLQDTIGKYFGVVFACAPPNETICD